MIDMKQDFENVYNAFKLYRDRFGLNQLNSNGEVAGVTQNGALFTIEYFVCLASLFPNNLRLLDEIERLNTVYSSLEVFPGVTQRFPGSPECDSMDNNSASLVFSAMWGARVFAKQMQEHGETTRALSIDDGEDAARNKKFYPIARLLNFFRAPKNFWNNSNPTAFIFSGWYGRSPGFMGLLNLCANDRFTIIQALSLLVGQFLGCLEDKQNADARKLPYIVWQLLKRKNIFWNICYKIWCKLLMKQYPNGMRDVYALYYQDSQHPIRKYSPPYAE